MYKAVRGSLCFVVLVFCLVRDFVYCGQSNAFFVVIYVIVVH